MLAYLYSYLQYVEDPGDRRPRWQKTQVTDNTGEDAR